jgi:hypothetical protein
VRARRRDITIRATDTSERDALLRGAIADSDVSVFRRPRRGPGPAPGLVRHLLVAARARRSAQRAHTTQKARHARAAPRARRRSASAATRKAARARKASKHPQIEIFGSASRTSATRARERRAPKHEREERDEKVSLRRARRTFGVVDGAGARNVCVEESRVHAPSARRKRTLYSCADENETDVAVRFARGFFERAAPKKSRVMMRHRVIFRRARARL